MIWKWTDEEYAARQKEGFPGLQSVQIIYSGDGYCLVNTVSIEEWNIKEAAKHPISPRLQ